MEYCELDFLGTAEKIDPHFKKLFAEVTGHKIKRKKEVQDKLYLNCE